MKPFYSLIKIVPNLSAGDNLTIGIILRDKEGFHVRFSKNKENSAKSLIPDSDIIDFLKKQITLKLKDINYKIKTSSKELFSGNAILSSEYFDYLNKYSNGILQFTPASLIHDEINEEKFNKLFKLLVDRFEQTEDKLTIKKEENFYKRINQKLIKRVEGKVHTNVKIDNKIIPSFVSHFEIDCIGLNGNLIGAKSLPMTQSRQTLVSHINTYINVITHLALKQKKGSLLDHNFYLISDEPTDIKSPEHRIWESIRKEEIFKLIPSEQSDIVAVKIEETKAGTFLDL